MQEREEKLSEHLNLIYQNRNYVKNMVIMWKNSDLDGITLGISFIHKKS